MYSNSQSYFMYNDGVEVKEWPLCASLKREASNDDDGNSYDDDVNVDNNKDGGGGGCSIESVSCFCRCSMVPVCACIIYL